MNAFWCFCIVLHKDRAHTSCQGISVMQGDPRCDCLLFCLKLCMKFTCFRFFGVKERTPCMCVHCRVCVGCGFLPWVYLTMLLRTSLPTIPHAQALICIYCFGLLVLKILKHCCCSAFCSICFSAMSVRMQCFCVGLSGVHVHDLFQ